MISLERFILAQSDTYLKALGEISQGRKKTHWMWFIFPQIEGLGKSQMSRQYGIKSKIEAIKYLEHPVLGNRLVEVCQLLLNHDHKSAVQIFGATDAMKLRSSMTLFQQVSNDKAVIFNEVLCSYYRHVDQVC